MNWEIITFIAYFVILLGVALVFYFNGTNKNSEDFFLGGRSMGPWVTALSAQASDMSAWLLMGLPGSILAFGFGQMWIGIGLALGTAANWILCAKRLRTFSKAADDAITLPQYLTNRFATDSRSLQLTCALIFLFAYTIYVASALVAGTSVFTTLFPTVSPKIAMFAFLLIIVAYTFFGGFAAVCWTDFFQGVLMFFAITIVPVMAYFQGGGINGIEMAMRAREISLNIFSRTENIDIFIILSGLAWGLGYFGQPHILVRFMSIDKVEELWKSRLIAMIWVVISLVGAIAVGVTGIAVFPNITELNGDAEKIFIYMIAKLFNPWIGGILFAAILSAIMSTISSQLLVSSNTLTEDFYKYIKRNPSNKELMWVGRLSILVIFFIAGILSLNPDSKVLSLVSYAWAGFGAVFGPAILITLYKKTIHWKSVLLGMIVSAITVVVWKHTGLGNTLYEILPGFVVNTVIILCTNQYLKTERE